MINNKRRSEEETVSSSSCGLPHQNVLWHDDDDDRDNEEEEESSAEGCDSDSNVLLAGNLRTIARKNLDELSSEECRSQLRQRYRLSTKIGTDPEWARPSKRRRDEENDESEEIGGDLDDLTRSAKNYVSNKQPFLPKKYLDNKLCRDITIGHSKGRLSLVKFHPFKPVLFTASNGFLSLFEICSDMDTLALKNKGFFLQDLKLGKYCPTNIDFHNDGLSLLASANKHGDCFNYDLTGGSVERITRPIGLKNCQILKIKLSSDGVYIGYMVDVADIHVYEFKTMEHIRTFRLSDKIVDFSFLTTNRDTVYGLAENGAIYTWYIKSPDEPDCFFDDGCVRATCLSVSGNGQFVACGSNTGIVNVYNNRSKQQEKKGNKNFAPLYTLENLTTSVSFVEFSRDAQLMAFGSDVKHMALKMFHCSSGEVFQDFPKKHEMFSRDRLTCAGFSPGNAFFATGAQSGQCRLYRFSFFNKY